MDIKQYIKNNYLIKTDAEMAKELGVLKKQISMTRWRLGLPALSIRNWTEKEIDIIKQYYFKPTNWDKLLSLLPDRNKTAIQKQASKLNISAYRNSIYMYEDQGYLFYRSSKIRKGVHRLVYEKHHGVSLTSKDIIHHIDGNKLNNNIDNLLLTNRSEHLKMHWKEIYGNRKDKRKDIV